MTFRVTFRGDGGGRQKGRSRLAGGARGGVLRGTAGYRVGRGCGCRAGHCGAVHRGAVRPPVWPPKRHQQFGGCQRLVGSPTHGVCGRRLIAGADGLRGRHGSCLAGPQSVEVYVEDRGAATWVASVRGVGGWFCRMHAGSGICCWWVLVQLLRWTVRRQGLVQPGFTVARPATYGMPNGGLRRLGLPRSAATRRVLNAGGVRCAMTWCAA